MCRPKNIQAVWYSEYEAWLSCIYEGFCKIWEVIVLTWACRIFFNETRKVASENKSGGFSSEILKLQGSQLVNSKSSKAPVL